MSHKLNVSGTWRDVAPYVNDSGTWKLSDYVWNKQGGEWYTSFVQGGLVDRSWDELDQTDSAGTGSDYIIYSLANRNDDKIVAGGIIRAWNGIEVGHVALVDYDGNLDTNFADNIGSGSNNSVYSVAVQSDGKILIGGFLTSWDGTSVGRIVRLNSDGTLDTAFTVNNGSGANSAVRSIRVQPDGKILIGGDFTYWNGVYANRFLRLNSDGTLDTSFKNNNGTAANGIVLSIDVQPDNKIIVAGNFTKWSVTNVGYIVRLNSDGTLDSSFTSNNGTGANGAIHSVKVQSDGKIIAGGLFNSWNGTSVGNIVRLNSVGTRETFFGVNVGSAANSSVYSVSVQPDGKIVLGGVFTFWNGTSANRIVRLNPDGSLDTAFMSNIGTGASSIVESTEILSNGNIIVGGIFNKWRNYTVGFFVRLLPDGSHIYNISSYFANNQVQSVKIQQDEKIIVGGYFTVWNGIAANRIVRLNSNGTLDNDFIANIGTAANSNVNDIAEQSDGKIIAVGTFTSWDGTSAGGIVRLNSDGSLDTAFMSNIGTGAGTYNLITSVAIQNDGKLLLGGWFLSWDGTTVGNLVRLNPNGTLDTFFSGSNGTGANSVVYSVALQSDGKIIIAGNLSSWNGTTVPRIARLNTDGTLDSVFVTNVGAAANRTVYALHIQEDDKILVGGQFNVWDGTSVGRIVRLNSDGTLDAAFTAGNENGANNIVYSIAKNSDGSIYVGGQFNAWNFKSVGKVVRLNNDGIRETEFTNNTGTYSDIFGSVFSISFQSDNKILLGGSFTVFGNGQEFRRYFVRIGGEKAA